MKKLFYIVATTVIILLFSIYMRQFMVPFFTSVKNNLIPSPTEKVDTLSAEEQKDCVCNSECICPEGQTDCDCQQTKSTCSCTKKNGEVVTVESIETNNANIEEIDPETTSHEDETIIDEQ